MTNRKKIIAGGSSALLLLAIGFALTAGKSFLHQPRSPISRIGAGTAAEFPVALRPVAAEALGRDDVAYRFSQTGGGYTAENAPNHYATTLAGAGARISGNDIDFTLALADAVYENPILEKNKISYRRPGMTEWFVNGPLGLEQGFTVAQKPANGPMALTLSIIGPVTTTIARDKRGVAIVSPNGKLINYHGLVAYDAAAKELPAWFEKNGRRLAIYIDDANARYPIVVDPFAQEQKLTASDGAANDFLGYKASMNADGTRVIVGADGADVGLNANQGAAYIFVRSGNAWTQEQKLTASDGAVDDSFGIGVAMSGDGTRVIIGADGEDGGGAGANNNQGYAYVFSRSGTLWSQEQKLTASDNATGDYFGFNVSMDSDGTRVIVGSDSDDIGLNSDRGSAYIFLRSGIAWSEEQKITASDGAANDHFGYNVSISSDGIRVIAGSGGSDIGLNANQGSAYVFSRSGVLWSQEQKLTASDGAANDNFGTGVAIDGSGTRAIVGAVNDDVGANTDQGSAYVFSRSGVAWNEERKLTASDGAANDYFGTGISADSDASHIIVGAGNADVGGNANQGAAYYFSRNGTAWTEEQKLTVGDTGSEFFGHKVSISSDGTRAVAGSYGADVGANTDQGAAYVFQLLSGGPGLSAFIRDLQSGFAQQYAARDAYTPNGLSLRAEHCTSTSCAATLQFNAPESATLERFSLRHSENRLRIPSAPERNGTTVSFTFPWSANSELPVRACYTDTNNAEYCAESRIWTPAAFTADEVIVKQRRVDDRYAVDIRIPSFQNFSYLAAGKSSVLLDARSENGSPVFHEHVIRPEVRSLLLAPGRYTITLTPINAAGEEGEAVTLPPLELPPSSEPISSPPAQPANTELEHAIESLSAALQKFSVQQLGDVAVKRQATPPIEGRPVEPAPIVELTPAPDIAPARVPPIITVQGGRVMPATSPEQLLNTLAPDNRLIDALRNLFSKGVPPIGQ